MSAAVRGLARPIKCPLRVVREYATLPALEGIAGDATAWLLFGASV